MHSSQLIYKKYLTLLPLFTLLWGMCATAANADVTAAQAQAIAALVVGDNSIPLKLNGPPFPRTDIPGMNGKIFRFVGPEVEGIEIDIDCTTGVLCRFAYRRLAHAGRTTKVSLSEAEKTGNDFLKRYLPVALQSQFKMQPSQGIDRGAGGKHYAMWWNRYVNSVKYPAGVQINVSVETGRVVRYLFVNQKILIPSLKPRITEAQAIRLAFRHLGIKLPPGGARAHLAVMGLRDNQALVWEIRLSKSVIGSPLHRKIDRRGIQFIIVNAQTGAWFNRFTSGKPLDTAT